MNFHWSEYQSIGLVQSPLPISHRNGINPADRSVFFIHLIDITMSQANRHVKLDEVWAKLLDGINHVYQFQAMKKPAYMLLYT